jgi:hypothetical protein
LLSLLVSRLAKSREDKVRGGKERKKCEEEREPR